MRTKDYLNPENENAGYRSATTQRRTRKENLAPGRAAQIEQDIPTVGVLLRQILIRVRRTWVAGKFKFNSLTFGLFQQKAFVKLAGLTFLGWFLLASDRDLGSLFSSPASIVSGKGEKPAPEGFEPDRSEFAIGGDDHSGNGHGKPVNWKENQAAPVPVGALTQDEAREYIERFGKIAQTEMEKFGIPASISLAQGLVESRAGTSTLARRNNNHFGMKCFSKRCAKGHCSNFKDDHHKDFFRIYKNAWESWRAHSEMLASGRYAALKKYGNDYKKWAYGLKSIGYATDRQYAEKLIGMIERYELYRYDR